MNESTAAWFSYETECVSNWLRRDAERWRTWMAEAARARYEAEEQIGQQVADRASRLEEAACRKLVEKLQNACWKSDWYCRETLEETLLYEAGCRVAWCLVAKDLLRESHITERRESDSFIALTIPPDGSKASTNRRLTSEESEGPDVLVNDPQTFGGCPHCGKNDGYLNIGRNHWFICHAHQTKWCVGGNLFSDWRSEVEEEWDTNQARIAPYDEVEPVYSEGEEK